MENQNQEAQQPEQPDVVQVERRFLQEILNYLTTKPYQEVHQFVDVLTGRQPLQPLQPQQSEAEPQTHAPGPSPEGFSADMSNQGETK